MKKCLISIMVLITVILLSVNVMAATTGAVTLTASTGTVKAKDELTITLKATDNNNLNTVEYSSITVTDASGKETNAITFKSVEVIGEWSNMNYDGKTAFVYSGTATKEQNVCKLTFTVSDNISAGTYNINVNGLTVYSTNLSDDTTTVGTKTVSVVVEEEKVDNGNTGNNIENNVGNNEGNNNNNESDKQNNIANNNSNESNKQDNTATGNNKLPQTGIEDTIVYAIIILGFASIVAYVSYRRYKDI